MFQVTYQDIDKLNDLQLTELLSHVRAWRYNYVQGILVVDNCSYELHQQLEQEISHFTSRLSLLTLSCEPATVLIPHVLYLKPELDETIEAILKQTYVDLPEKDLKRLSRFAQGFPQVAVLMADAYFEYCRTQ